MPHDKGVALHDHWASYLQSANCQHEFCNVDHLRELCFVVEQYDQTGAKKVAALLRATKVEIELSPAWLTALPPNRLAFYERVRCVYCRRRPRFCIPAT